MRVPLIALGVAVILTACSSWSDRREVRSVTCQSRGDFTDCERVGRDAVVMTRQISDAACVEGMSWGVRDGRLWVDRGCRAEFRVGGRDVIASSDVYGDSTIRCESENGQLTRCPANTFGGVRLVRQLSSSECVLDRTWGWDRSGVWVNEGCRAEFVTGTTASTSRVSLICESQSGRRNHCPADTRYGVDLVRQISESPCIRNRTWGEDRDGVWVDEGCRAEFAVRTR